jgi:hypothetical protein
MRTEERIPSEQVGPNIAAERFFEGAAEIRAGHCGVVLAIARYRKVLGEV